MRIPKGEIGGTAFELVCRPNRTCTATTSTTLPPGVPDVGGVWTFVPDAIQHDCGPDFDSWFSIVQSIRIQQIGDRVRACRDQFLDYESTAFKAPDALRLVGHEWGTTFSGRLLDFHDTLSAAGFSPGDSPLATMTLAFEEPGIGPGAPVCSGTASGSLLPAACVDDDACVGGDACTRCVGGRCRPVPRCRWEGWCVPWQRRCQNPEDYGGPFPLER